MNRLSPALPGAWFDELLPGKPDHRPGPRQAWRFATAAASPPPPAALHKQPAGLPGKAGAPAHAEPARMMRTAAAQVRELPPEDDGACRISQDGSGGGQGSERGDTGGQDDAGPAVSSAAPAGAEAFDALDIVVLLPSGECSGIFEVQLPGGEAMAVAVDARPAAVAYHLKPAGKGLADRLRGRQKELSAHLERRIGKDVTLTIL